MESDGFSKKNLVVKLSEMFVEHLVHVVDDFKLMFQNNIDEILDMDSKGKDDPFGHAHVNVPSAPID